MRPKAARITLSDDETRAWTHVLPALVERCRDWKHTLDCRYLSDKAVQEPSSADEWALCECGEGKGTDALKRKKDWAPFAEHATRVAVSPLFAVSYLEKMCEGALGNMVDILGDQGAYVGDMKLLLEVST